MELNRALEPFGGIASRALLGKLGLTDRTITDAVNDGWLIRLRRGRYATPTAHPDVAAAVRAGGRLACASALRVYGTWLLPDPQLHVRVARGVDATRSPAIKVHWNDERGWGHPVDSAAIALVTALRCLPLRDAVVAVDSVANKRLLTLSEIESACATTARGRAVLRLMDPLSESGLETMARLALRRHRIRLRSQFLVEGIGRVDLLIGDRLVLELDGEAWHGDFDRDRARDRALVVRGYLVLRVSYRQLMTQWADVEAQILDLVRRDEHLWRARDRRNSDGR
jgi:very-short-patch-repair endonuclease